MKCDNKIHLFILKLLIISHHFLNLTSGKILIIYFFIKKYTNWVANIKQFPIGLSRSNLAELGLSIYLRKIFKKINYLKT